MSTGQCATSSDLCLSYQTDLGAATAREREGGRGGEEGKKKGGGGGGLTV